MNVFSSLDKVDTGQGNGALTSHYDGWSEPELRFLTPERPEPPELPLEVFGAQWSRWITQAAEAKSAPSDYVAAGLLAVAGSLIGNTRWVSPWDGWFEPPIIWAMAIGNPSMNKSPGLDAVLSPLKAIEKEEREAILSILSIWSEKAEVAKLAEQTWKDATKAALKANEELPEKPKEAELEPEPTWPRLAVNDATVEKLAVIVSKQSRGTLLARDELSGWLHGMVRYSGGGSDRPFWLEAYGGRGYSVERMGRDPVYVDRLSIGVIGGIQPDKLKTLLLKSDDDGLLARLVPVWPNRAELKRPGLFTDHHLITTGLKRLLHLKLVVDENDVERPWFVHFSEEARTLLQEFRLKAREWEDQSEGLMLSFNGKLAGLSVRLSLVFAFLDWAASGGEEPIEIQPEHYRRAAHFAEYYAKPMAERSYADISLPKEERAARRLCLAIKDRRLRSFSTREIQRLQLNGLRVKAELDPALDTLLEAGLIKEIKQHDERGRGRPPREFTVHPVLWEAA